MFQFQKYVDHFKEKITDSWLTPRGVFFSEGFAISSAMNECGVQLIIESGTAYGGSTEMLALLCNNTPIVSIDFCKLYTDSGKYSAKRLEKYKNVKLVIGNSFNVIPDILSNVKLNNIGLFIDGPKGYQALNLVSQIVQKYNDKISVVAVHDVKSHTPIADEYRKQYSNVLFTKKQIRQLFKASW